MQPSALRVSCSPVNAYEYTVGVRVKHPDIDPAEVTAALGFKPEHSWKAGESRRTPQGEPLEGAYRESYWTARVIDADRISSDTLPLEVALGQSLARLQRADQFLARINAEGGSIALFVGIFGAKNFGFEFPPTLLLRMGRLGVTMTLDVYS